MNTPVRRPLSQTTSLKKMHSTALYNCEDFFHTYGSSFKDGHVKVVEIGSQDVNGSIRQCAPKTFEYIGVDFVPGNGVDVVIDDPYKLPFADDSVDIVLTNSCLEHSEMFWLLYLEMIRIMKPHGLLYVNAPSNGEFHRYPVDCWRFYPDCSNALVNWGRRNGYRSAVLESFTSEQEGDVWNDYVTVIVKDEATVSNYPNRIAVEREDLSNVFIHGQPNISNLRRAPEDKRKLYGIRELIADKSVQLNDAQKLQVIQQIIDNQIKCR